MARIIEAKAVISAEDRTGKVLDGIARKFRDVGKGSKVSAEVDRLNKSLAQTEKGLRSIERINAAQAKLDAARLSRTGAETEAARIRTALDQARKVDNAKAVSDLTAQQRAAERAVSAATASIQRQERAVAEARRELNALGVPVTNLVAHERALKSAHDATTASVEKLARAERERARFAQERAANVERRYGRPQSAGAAAREASAGGGGSTAASAIGAGAVARFGAAAAGIGGGAYVAGEGLRKAYGSAVSFERSMIEVGKATDASGAELDAYGEKVLALARATGKTKEELGSMLSSAGFAGRPKEELMDFTEYAAKATVAWQTSAEETGQALAEIGNIYEANQKRIEQIGDAINTMADNSASRETDLLEFMRRAGASSREAGISAENMLAFGAAMKEVGVRNEVAATGFEALLNVMKLGDKFSKSAGKGLKALGINSDEMRKQFVAKPVETTISLLEKLRDVTDKTKKAEIMTDLFGKEYQDDIAKILNALPKLTQYIGLMNDKAKLAAGGVRLQFAQNLDKDVSKIDRATQAIDVLMKRLGDPIKAQAGGIADQINKWVDRLEHGDTVAQRLLSRLTGPKGKDEKPKEEDEGDPMGRVVTKILQHVDPKFGKTPEEQARMDREADAAARAEAERRTLAAPGEIEGQIARRRAVLERSRQVGQGPPGIQRDMARVQIGKSEAEIARLEGELAKAWEAIGALRVQQKRDRGAFGLNGPAGKDGESIGRPNFGFGPNGTDTVLPRSVPLPPQRPPELGKAEPKVDKSEVEIARLEGELAKAWEAIGALRVQQKRDRGAFGLNGPAGKDGESIGRPNFGFGPNGTDTVLPRSVPLPPQRPPELGKAEPKVDKSEVEAVKPAAADAKAALEELNLTVTPNVSTASISAARQDVRALKSELAEVGALASSVRSSVSGISTGIRARSSSSSLSDGATPGAGGP